MKKTEKNNFINKLNKAIAIMTVILFLFPPGIVHANNSSTIGCSFKPIDHNIVNSSINRSIDYFITAMDHYDILNNSTLDNIAIITLTEGKNISILDIKIVITCDRINFLQINVINQGVWHVGEQLIIKEILPDEVQTGYYKIYVLDTNYLPITVALVSLDNAPITNIFFERTNNTQPLGMPTTQSSICYYSNSQGAIAIAMAVAIEYYSRTWVNFGGVGVWEYQFKMSLVYSTSSTYLPYCNLNTISFYTNDCSGINDIGYLRKGGWNVKNQQGTGGFSEIGQIVAEKALSKMNPVIDFALTLTELLTALRDTPDINWEASGYNIKFASGFAYFETWVNPQTTWHINFNAEAREFSQGYVITLDGKWGSHGEGKIQYGETSPSEPTNDDLIARETWISSHPDDWYKNYVVSEPTVGQQVYLYFEYSWTGSGTCPIHHVKIFIDSTLQGEGDISDLPGQQINVVYATTPWTVTLGPHTVTGQTDTNDDIQEANENNNEAVYEFTVTDANSPVLSYSHAWIPFGTHTPGWSGDFVFSIWNSGYGTLTYEISESLSWLQISPTSGMCTRYEQDLITATVLNTESMLGNYNGYIYITSNGGSGQIYVTITIEEPNPCLDFSPETINFGTHDQGWTDNSYLNIWNSNTGTLSYTISESIPWIMVSPTSGSSTGESDTITVSVVNTGSMSGYYSGDIQISSNGGSGTVHVEITVVLPNPQLSYSPSSINFGTQIQGWAGSRTFEIWNSGTGTLDYSISETINWISSVDPVQGSSTGEHDIITVNVNIDPSMLGHFDGDIQISSNGGSGAVHVEITIVPPSPQLSYSPMSINFGTHVQGWTGTNTFEIWNSGTGTLSYTISESIPWISVSPTSGTSTGEHDTITVSVVNTGSLLGYYEGNIQISSNGGTGTLPVSITIERPTTSFFVNPTDVYLSVKRTRTGTSLTTIFNDGNVDLYWGIRNISSEWTTGFIISPLSGGPLSPGGSVNVNIQVTAPWSPLGDLRGQFTVYANGCRDVIVNVHLHVERLCFLAGTKITMADGTYKNIEDVKVGDMVLSYDGVNNKMIPAKVTNVDHHITKDELADQYIIINNDLRVTPDHPLLINGKWMEAGKAKVGDSLLKAVNQKTVSPVPIKSLKTMSQSVPTYNLHVDVYHTYVAGGVVACDKWDSYNSEPIST